MHHRSLRVWPATATSAWNAAHTTPTKSTPKSGNQQFDASIDKIRNMIPKSAIHWQGLVKAVSSYRFKKQIPRRRSREHGGSSCPEPWYYYYYDDDDDDYDDYSYLYYYYDYYYDDDNDYYRHHHHHQHHHWPNSYTSYTAHENHVLQPRSGSPILRCSSCPGTKTSLLGRATSSAFKPLGNSLGQLRREETSLSAFADAAKTLASSAGLGPKPAPTFAAKVSSRSG